MGISKGKGISEKLTKAIVSIMLLSSFVIGLAGIIGILIINNASQKIYNNDLIPLSSLYKISYDFSCVRVDLRDLIMGNQNANTKEAAINTYFGDMNKQLKIYKSELISVDEISNYNSMEEYVSSFSDLKNNIIKSVNSKEPEIAQQMLGENTSDQLNGTITNAFKINTNRAQQRNLTSIEILFIVLFAILIVISISALVSVRIGKRISKKISDPINKLVTAANAISVGNLDVDIDIDEDDETGILAESFKKTIVSLRRMNTAVEWLISEALEGNLDKRAELKSHDGDYRKIIDGVNRMLDTVKTPLDVASNYINNLAKGVKQPNIENIYKGYYTVFIDNLNKVNDAINILAQETQKLAIAGTNGELSVRGDDSRLKGTYSEIIIGINNTFDAIKNPLDSASNFISKLANGNTSETLDNCYKGYYAALVDNLNNVRGSLIILLDEAQKLVDAGRNGELEVRGNTQTVNGSYADIIRGMNEIFESIVKPLNESGHVLEKIAVNDFTVCMSDNYNGVLKKFAKSINSVRERMLIAEGIFTEISKGSIDSLDALKESGKLSENDRMIPSMISTMEAIKELIEETGNQAAAAFEGNLSYKADVSRFDGGYRKVIEGMNKTMGAVDAPIEESSHVLSELAQGNLAVEMTGKYNGEYNKIKTSLNNTAAAFNELISQINAAANQVNSGSSQVSDASQLLAQGATEQASYVEQLTASITDVAEHTKRNAVSAAQASTFAKDAQGRAAEGNAKMSEMLESMREINDSSSNISKIIRVIDDIAFQTNILALNAAVEAARAGQYGKGFSVIAQDVRNLAAKSADAARETAELIDGTIKKVESGTRIANETASMLATISESVQKATDIVESIALASDKQTKAITNVDKGISQVLSVVQTNSATAEESAALSKGLSSEANMLMMLVGRFNLK